MTVIDIGYKIVSIINSRECVEDDMEIPEVEIHRLISLYRDYRRIDLFSTGGSKTKRIVYEVITTPHFEITIVWPYNKGLKLWKKWNESKLKRGLL